MGAISEAGNMWVHISPLSAEDLEYLRRHFRFHPLDLEDLTSRTEHPKLDIYDDYLFAVMHFPVYNSAHRFSAPCELHCFVGANYMVTVHDGRLKPLNDLFAECQRNSALRQDVLGKGAGRLFYTILDRLVDYIFPMLARAGGEIAEIEEELFSANMGEMITRIAYVRRDIITLRSILRPQMTVISHLEGTRFPFLPAEMRAYFGDILDGFTRALELVENYHEVIQSLSDTSMALTSYRINEVMRILTIISVILLPLSLISGIYGMNIALPLADSPWAFVLILGLMVLVAGVMLAFFRRRGWL
ncbi:MAG: magnesium/cobalt transporter CorA [Anaerolineae bacterium]